MDVSATEKLRTAQDQHDAAVAGQAEQQQLLEQIRHARRKAEQSLVQAERDVAQGNARLESLESLDAAHEGVEEHAKKALDVDGVLGTLADHMDVPESLDTLVATALGEELEYVLVPDTATAIKVAEATRGRVSMLLLGPASKPEGVFGDMAGDAVGEQALGRLLGACVEVESVETAIQRHQAEGGAFLVPKGPGGLPIMVTPRGEIRIGPAKTGATMVLQRRRDLAAIRAKMPQLTAELEAAQTRLELCVNSQEGAVRSLGWPKTCAQTRDRLSGPARTPRCIGRT